MKNYTLVTKSSMPPIDEYINEIRDLWDTHWLTNMGVKHKLFQDRLIEYLGTDNLELFVNGHMALEMAIQAFDFPRGSEIITTPYTFVSTVHAIARNGLVPVFCDIKESDFCINESKIESLITDRTCAILPVHVYGNVCNVEEIGRIAKDHDLKVIYDAAHAFGVTYKGKGIGSFGNASCFSFHATKVFNSIEGGAVSYHDDSIGKALRNLRNFGIQNEEDVTAIGANAKMNEFCAAMGICNLRHIDEEIDKRSHVAERYIRNLEGVPGVTTYSGSREGVKRNFAYFPVVFRNLGCDNVRDKVFKALLDNGVKARKYFFPIISDMQCYKGEYNSDKTPVACSVAQGILTLPMFSDIDLSEVDRICSIIISTIE